MKSIFDTYQKTGTLHHAYCIEGAVGDSFVQLCTHIEESLKVPVRGNPDFWHGQYEAMTIDEARALKEMQMRTSAGGGKKIFVISVESINREAQNSLLKMFEEPTADTHFFLLIASAESLLPTVKSRLQIVFAKRDGGHDRAGFAQEFIKASKPERLTMVKDFSEEKDKGGALQFLNALEAVLRLRRPPEKMSQADRQTFEELLKMKGYLADRGSSVKLILEHVALIV